MNDPDETLYEEGYRDGLRGQLARPAHPAPYSIWERVELAMWGALLFLIGYIAAVFIMSFEPVATCETNAHTPTSECAREHTRDP